MITLIATIPITRPFSGAASALATSNASWLTSPNTTGTSRSLNTTEPPEGTTRTMRHPHAAALISIKMYGVSRADIGSVGPMQAYAGDDDAGATTPRARGACLAALERDPARRPPHSGAPDRAPGRPCRAGFPRIAPDHLPARPLLRPDQFAERDLGGGAARVRLREQHGLGRGRPRGWPRPHRRGLLLRGLSRQ